MMEQKKPARVARGEERRLIELAIQTTRRDFPNPERHECPERDMLEGIARRAHPQPGTDDAIDHIAMCAACFEDYIVMRRRHHHRRISRIVLASAAALMLVFAIGWRIRPTLVPPRRSLTVHPFDATLTATLDFRLWTKERSAIPHPPESFEVPHIRRGLFVLTIELPIGIEDGIYALEVRNQLNQTVIKSTGTARWNGSTEILITSVDLRRLVPGDYLLVIGTTNSSWRRYPVRVE